MESVELLRLLDEIKQLKDKLESLQLHAPAPVGIPHRSESISELAASLSKAQGEFKVADLNKTNPYFKSRYADFMSVVQAARPALTKYNLSVYQDILVDADGASYLYTVLLHASGQYIESRMRVVPPKNDIQSMSSYVTYLKRLAYASLVGVVTGEDDDDGEVAVAQERETFAKGVALNTKYNPKEVSPEVITREQLEELEYELAEHPDICEQVLEGLKIQSLADMPRTKFLVAIKRIREIKNLRNGIK